MNTPLLRNLAEHANQLPPKDLEKLDYLIQKTRMYTNQIYGSESSYHKTLILSNSFLPITIKDLMIYHGRQDAIN